MNARDAASFLWRTLVSAWWFAFRRRTPSRIYFTVVDSSVEGFGGTLVVNRVVGRYSGSIALRPAAFDVSLVLDFGTYFSDAVAVPSQLDTSGVNPQRYGLYATLTASGLWEGTGVLADPYRMTFSQADAHVFLDPQQDTSKTLPALAGSPVVLGNVADDREVCALTNIVPSESVGALTTGASGNFLLAFDQPTITTPGATYWPGLPSDGLRALLKADVDNPDIANGTFAGDVAFEFWSMPIVWLFRIP